MRKIPHVFALGLSLAMAVAALNRLLCTEGRRWNQGSESEKHSSWTMLEVRAGGLDGAPVAENTERKEVKKDRRDERERRLWRKRKKIGREGEESEAKEKKWSFGLDPFLAAIVARNKADNEVLDPLVPASSRMLTASRSLTSCTLARGCVICVTISIKIQRRPTVFARKFSLSCKITSTAWHRIGFPKMICITKQSICGDIPRRPQARSGPYTMRFNSRCRHSHQPSSAKSTSFRHVTYFLITFSIHYRIPTRRHIALDYRRRIFCQDSSQWNNSRSFFLQTCGIL